MFLGVFLYVSVSHVAEKSDVCSAVKDDFSTGFAVGLGLASVLGMLVKFHVAEPVCETLRFVELSLFNTLHV